MSPCPLRKTQLFIILLGVFLSSCVNELKLIKVKGREPIPYEFAPTNNENIEEPITSIPIEETLQIPQLTIPDGSEETIPTSTNEVRKIVKQELQKDQRYQQLNKNQQTKIEKLAIKKAEKLNKTAAAAPPMKANIIIGSILSVVGVFLIIGGIASLFTAASAAVYIILGVAVFIVGAFLVFRGIAVSRHKK